MGDQGEYDQNDQQNYEESYESDIQKKFERELQNMERSRQKESYNNQEDYNDGYQNEQNQEDGQQNYNNEDQQGDEYDQQQEEYNQEGNNGEYQDQDQNVEENQQDQSYEQHNQQEYDQQNHSQVQENSQNLQEDNNQENFDNEEVSKKVETHQNDDGSITTVTYTTVTKTKKIDLQDYSMPTIEEQETDKQTKSTKNGLNKEKSQSPNQNKNIFNQLDEVSQQKLMIKSLKEELKDEREINTIQALEIESLKQLVRKLQGNIETLQLQLKGEQNTQQISSPYKTENSKRSEPILNQVKIYQSMEVKTTKQDVSNIHKTQSLKNNEQDEIDASENGQQSQEKVYLTTFQKSLWIPQKEKMAEKQLYEIPVQEQEQKQKTLRPLKKITPKDKQQLQLSKINNDTNSQSDLESKNKKKTDASVFDEELSKIAKQNREQFAVVYKQNKLKLRQEMFEDYQKRKQELLEKRENRNKLDANWQESLHPVSRAKSVKNISVNVFNMSDKQHRHDLRTPSYMERQMQTIKNEMNKINSKSISNLPTLENGYSPNSISSIAAGNNLRKQMEIKSSISIPNISQSPDNQFSKSQVNKKKLFLYQITDADKNYLLKSHQYKHLKLTKDELKQQQENIENLKEKHKEEEQKKLERYDQLKVSPGYCLMRKNSEELRRSQVQSAKSNHRKSQESHSNSQITVSYPALSGLLSQNINMNQNNSLDKDQFISSSTSSKVVVKGNPYSLESNPQKEEAYPPTPKKKVKSQIITTQITTTSATQSLQHPGLKNPYVVSNVQKSKEGHNNENNIWNEEQDKQKKKSTSQDNGKIKVSQITYATTSTTRNYKKEETNKQQQNNQDDDKNDSNKLKNIEKPAQDRRNTDQNSLSDSNNKTNSPTQDEKNKVPIGNYKIQQHEYNELFSKGKLKNDNNKKQINWDDKVIENKNDQKNKINSQQNDKNNQNGNKQQQQLQQQQQQKLPQNQQNYQNRVQNTYFQQKYSTQQPYNQIQQTRQPPQQKQPSNQQAKKQIEQQNKNNINQQPQNQKANQQQVNLNNSMNKSQVSKNSQQDSNRGSDSYKSASPKQNLENNYQYNQYAEDQPQEEYEQDYQDQDYVQRPQSNSKKDNGDESEREKYNNQYNSDYNKMQGLGNLQGVQGKFTQFNAQGQQVVQNQKPYIQKREPKVREQPPPPKKSEFVEKLEKEAQKDSKVEVRDEKVYLKPIESDDEPMFGYDSSEQEEDEEEQPQQKTQKRSSIKQSNSVSNNQKKRVSIKREEENYEQEEEEEDETKYRKTPRTPFNQNDQDDEDQYS
ncbi:hypothetical protein ABPG74_011564 [Tetrahymena malaccensis]